MPAQNPDTELAQRVARTEAGISALHADVKSIAESEAALTKTDNDRFEARSGVNWGAVGVVVLVLTGAIGGAYALQSKENERVYAEMTHIEGDMVHDRDRLDRKLAKLDDIDGESARDRVSAKESLREVETQLSGIKRDVVFEERIAALLIDKEQLARDLAIERARAK